MKAPRLRWVIFAAAVTFLIAVLLTSFFKELEKMTMLSDTLDKRMEELVAEEKIPGVETEDRILQHTRGE